MFCPKCKKLMLPDKGSKQWVCRACGAKVKMSGGGDMVPHSEPKHREITVISEKPATNPTAKEECPKCGNDTAYWVLRQTRGADEPETRIFECTKCGNKWREYQ
ncbi:MAG: transcription factor S [Euryarchaeota archaeon]|nr:transcription factor S [Euryarchaeota archaeon]MDE1836998.1 transcription factor S [Euryarchaeota archaeon]MDE1881924.1 transcription factor S [Euryarchaeota archaeon]MDE2045656.1 transcription factor S [Thermoplasmata archaeon]